jgi:hypothetical protein
MTGLTGDIRMLATTVHLGFLIVAEDALAMPRVGDGASTDHLECARPVVSVFPEVLGHHNGADDQENSEPRKQDERRTNQVSGILE